MSWNTDFIIGCRECSFPDCRGCNVFELHQALHAGVFNSVTDANHHIDIDLLREALKERKTGKWIFDGCKDICSECGASRENQLWDEYCGRCGLKMEVDE